MTDSETLIKTKQILAPKQNVSYHYNTETNLNNAISNQVVCKNTYELTPKQQIIANLEKLKSESNSYNIQTDNNVNQENKNEKSLTNLLNKFKESINSDDNRKLNFRYNKSGNDKDRIVVNSARDLNLIKNENSENKIKNTQSEIIEDYSYKKSQFPTDLYTKINPLNISNKMDQIDIDLISNQILNKLKTLENDKSYFEKENFNLKIRASELESANSNLKNELAKIKNELNKGELSFRIKQLEKEKIELFEELRLKSLEASIKKCCDCELKYKSYIEEITNKQNHNKNLLSIFYLHFGNLADFIENLKEKHKLLFENRYEKMDKYSNNCSDTLLREENFISKGLLTSMNFKLDDTVSAIDTKRVLSNIENILITLISDKVNKLRENYLESQSNKNNSLDYSKNELTKQDNLSKDCSREIDYFRERIGLSKKSPTQTKVNEIKSSYNNTEINFNDNFRFKNENSQSVNVSNHTINLDASKKNDQTYSYYSTAQPNYSKYINNNKDPNIKNQDQVHYSNEIANQIDQTEQKFKDIDEEAKNQIKSRSTISSNIYKKLVEAKSALEENKKDQQYKAELSPMHNKELKFNHYTNNHLFMDVNSIDKDGKPSKTTNPKYKTEFVYLQDHKY